MFVIVQGARDLQDTSFSHEENAQSRQLLCRLANGMVSARLVVIVAFLGCQ